MPSTVTSQSFPNNWPYVFFVKTIERDYVLYAKTEDERKMWMAGFRYVIASTQTVQVIMKQNAEIQNKKLKERTQQLIQQQIKKYGEEELMRKKEKDKTKLCYF